jgi:hypothetical protein
MRGDEAYDGGFAAYAGWVAGGLVIVGVFLFGLGVWLKYHP